MSSKWAVGVIVLFLAVAITGPAEGAVILQFNDGVTTKTIADGSGDVVNAAAGAVTWIGSLGVWTINVSTAIGSEVLGIPGYPQVDLNSVNTSSGAGSLGVYLFDTDLTSPVDPLGVVFGIGGTTSGSVIAGSCIDLANGADVNCSAPGSTNLGPFGPGAFSGQTSYSTAGTGDIPFALKIGVVITHNRAGVSSFDANANAVPEPSTMLMCGLALLGVSGWRRRRSRRA